MPEYQRAQKEYRKTNALSGRNKNPDHFDERRTHHLNEALRYSLKFLRLAEKNHGSNSDICCVAHQGLAGILWTARLREKTVYHMGVALKIAEKVYRMQTDGSSERIDQIRRQYDMYRTTTPSAECLELEDDVRAGLSRNSATRKCDASGCNQVEGVDGCTLMKCSKCASQRYCSPECQRAEWPNHKGQCKRIAAIAREMEADKGEQKRKNKEDKKFQRQLKGERP